MNGHKEIMRLTPFEEFMHVDDRAAYPMVFFYRLRFAGTLDAAKLTRVVQDAARRQPLLASTVEKIETSRVEYYVWKPSDRRVPVVWETTTDADADPHTPHLNITQEVGLRLFVTERHLESGVVTDLLFQVHHACCDGIGVANFVEGVLRTYAAGDDDANLETPANSLGNVPRGDVARRRWWQWPFAFVLRLALLLRLAFVYLRRAAPLVVARPDFDSATPPATFPSLLVRQLTREATQRILETSRRANVTVNDLLLAAAYRTASETNASDARPIRLSIPVNLRTAAETNAITNTAANVVSMIFLDRHRAAIVSPQRLLASVHRAMLWGKWLGDAETLLVGLRFTKWFPRLLPHVVRGRNRCWATVVVSNLGRLYTATPLPRSPRGEIIFGNAVGDAVLTRVELAPPIRGWTAAAIGIATYAGAMTFTLNYDSGRMTRDEAERFLSQFVACAEAACGSA